MTYIWQNTFVSLQTAHMKFLNLSKDIRKIVHHLPTQLLADDEQFCHFAYKTLVNPKLEYASLVLDLYQLIHKAALDKFQRQLRIKKIDCDYYGSVIGMLRDHNWDIVERIKAKTWLVTIYQRIDSCQVTYAALLTILIDLQLTNHTN